MLWGKYIMLNLKLKASQENSKMHVQEPNDISQNNIQEES
jgi:hypothetical protein